MAKYTTHKNTHAAKSETVERKRQHALKRRVSPTYGDNGDAARAMRLLARELGAVIVS